MSDFLQMLLGQQQQQPQEYQFQVPNVAAAAPLPAAAPAVAQAPLAEAIAPKGAFGTAKEWLAKPENREKVRALALALAGPQNGRSNSEQLSAAIGAYHKTGEARKAQTRQEALDAEKRAQENDLFGTKNKAANLELDKAQLGLDYEQSDEAKKKKSLELKKLEAEIAKLEQQAKDAPNEQKRLNAQARLSVAQARVQEIMARVARAKPGTQEHKDAIVSSIGKLFMRPVVEGDTYGPQTMDVEAFDTAYAKLYPQKAVEQSAPKDKGYPAGASAEDVRQAVGNPEKAKAVLKAAGKAVTQANIDYLVNGGKKPLNQASGKVTPAK